MAVVGASVGSRGPVAAATGLGSVPLTAAVVPSTSRTHKLAGVAFGFSLLPAGQGSALEIAHEVGLRVWKYQQYQ